MNKWDKNIWTGNYILKLSKNTRIIRMGYGSNKLYRKEFWGDYSFNYPVCGDWVRTLQQAKKSKVSEVET